jgi:hypothetical protein
LLEMAANRTDLDAGQASLVRQMCTSGARLQLAIAPRRCQVVCVNTSREVSTDDGCCGIEFGGVGDDVEAV